MKIVGLIAEYNPLHYGHAYQIEQIKKHSQCDVLVVVMSGNVVQRGQFAIVDKWSRAQMAVESGVDIVFELPLLASLQSADYFAETSIQLLKKLQCQAVYFGTETATIEQLTTYVEQIEQNEVIINERIQVLLKQGYAYAAAYTDAVRLLGNVSFDSSSPNHQLGIQYIKANRKLAEPMQLYTIQRLTHNEKLLSATKVRAKILAKQLLATDVPMQTYQQLSQQTAHTMDDYWPLLKYQLMTQTAESLQLIFGVKEGLENAILAHYRTVNNWDELVTKLISKRWTRASIQRILLAVLGQITETEWENYRSQFANSPIVRLLAYRSANSAYLKILKQSDVIIIANWRKTWQQAYQLQWRMDEIFAQRTNQPTPEQNLTKFPIIIN